MGLCLLINLGSFQQCFFKYFFSPTLFLLFNWDSDDINIWVFVIIPWVPEAIFIFFFFFPLCFLDLVISVVFQFTDTPIPILLLILSIEFFIPVAEYFSPKISTFFFLYSLYFSGTLYFFPEAFYLQICFNFTSIYSSKHFIIVALKSWSNNSNISVILMLAPIDCLFFPWFEIFLDLVRQVMFSWNLDFSCYVMRLWISFKPVLTGFLCHHSGRGRGSCR